MAISLKVDRIPVREQDALTFQQDSLVFGGSVRFYADFSLCINYPMPRELVFFTARMQDPYDLSCTAGTSSELSNLTICHHFTWWDLLNDLDYLFCETFQMAHPFVLSVS